MRPNPTNFVEYGTCGQTALLQRNFNMIPPPHHNFSEEVWPDRTFHIPQSLWDLDASIFKSTLLLYFPGFFPIISTIMYYFGLDLLSFCFALVDQTY